MHGVIGGDLVIGVTSDGGATWTPTWYWDNGHFQVFVEDIDFIDAMRAVTASTDYGDQPFSVPRGNPLQTIDGGASWDCGFTLSIYDVAGRHVVTLVDAVREPGVSTAEWNGTDAGGRPVASGVYVSRLRVGTKSTSRTLVLLK